MRIFTRLGITFLLAVFATGMLWAQRSEAEIAAKMKTLNNGVTKTVIGGGDVDANVIAVGTPMSTEKIINLNIPTQTTNSKGTDETEIIGSDTNGYNEGPRSRGNAFHCTEDKILVEFMGWHDVTTDSTQMLMCIYEGDEALGTYSLVSASDISPAPLGLGWVSSGVIDFPLEAGKYYLLFASFDRACGYYNDDAVTPFPYPVAFGEAIGGVGYVWAPANVFPPSETLDVVDPLSWEVPVLYYQQLVTEDVTHFDNDMGIKAILSPNSGEDLSNVEVVTVNIKNYGTVAQTGFDVSYTMNGGTTVSENISETINGGETLEHTFAGTVDLSAYGVYEFVAWTDLAGDENTDNDLKTKTVENYAPTYCDASTTNEDEFIANVLCGSIDNASGWQGGVADYTAMSTTIGAGMSEDIIVTNGNPWLVDSVYAWVDWNDDLEWTGGDEEFVIITDGTGAVFTGAISVPADAAAGMHRMRIRMVYSDVPEPCGNSAFGEVEDYSIMVGSSTGIEDQVVNSTQLYPNPASKLVNIRSEYTIESITVYNFAGQVILTEAVNSNNYQVNTSNLNTGIYLFQIETEEGRIAKRIIIK